MQLACGSYAFGFERFNAGEDVDVTHDELNDTPILISTVILQRCNQV